MIIEKKFKRGIAMIELIFAIVIIGIVLLSSPMLIQQSINSSFVAMQQEAIAAAASQTATLLSKPWDEKDASNVANAAPIITLQNATNSPLRGRGGLIGLSDNSRIAIIPNKDTNASDINTADFNESIANDNLDDIDDYNSVPPMGISVFNSEGTTASTGDYVDVNLTITNKITFADDTPNGNIGWNVVAGSIDAGNNIFNKQTLGTNGTGTIESHIKFVKVNLKSANPTNTAELVKDITLNAFSCNLGTYPMGDKTFD